jgi:hypothetical protein
MGLTLGRESIRYATTTLPFRWLMITGSELWLHVFSHPTCLILPCRTWVNFNTIIR